MSYLIGIQSKDVNKYWDSVEPLIKRCLYKMGDQETVQDILDGLLLTDKQLWIAYNDNQEILGCVVTQLFSKGNDKYLCYHLISGKSLAEWFEHRVIIESWAKENGCVGVQIYGREGWLRLLKNDGYQVDFISLSRFF